MKSFWLALIAAGLCLASPHSSVSQSSSTSQFIDQKFLSQPYSRSGCGAVAYEGDFNGDGRPDVAFPVCFQNANGTFSLAPRQPSFPELNGNYYVDTLTIADMNRDGIADYIYTATPPEMQDGTIGDSMVFIYLGNGDGSVKPAIGFDVGANFAAGGVVAADLNGDGTVDLAISTPTGLMVLLNDGFGKLHGVANPPSYPMGTLAVADVNGDRKPDLILSSSNFNSSTPPITTSEGVEIYLGNGDGTFTAGAKYLVGRYISGTSAPPVIADFNHDGHPDFAALFYDRMCVFLGNGHGAFKLSATKRMTFTIPNSANYPNIPTAAATPTGLFTADFNRDGHADLVVSMGTEGQTPATATAIYSGNGDGTFTNPRIYSTGTSTIQVGDFNHDANPDVLSEDTSSAVVLFRGDGKGNLHAAAGTLAPAGTSLVHADFNGDHIQDIAVVSKANVSPYFPCTDCLASVTVYLGTGKGYFKLAGTYAVGLIDGNIAAGDINGDGKIDLVVTRVLRQNESSPNPPPTDTSVMIGNGNGTFRQPDNMTLLGAPYGMSYNINTYLVDVNHDGHLDLIGDWGVALGDGTGSFHPPNAFPSIPPQIVSIGLGDFNGDHNVDIAVATSGLDTTTQGAALYTLLGDGKGNFTIGHKESHPYGSTFDAIGSLAVADINHDGKPDLLFTSTSYARRCCSMLQVDLGQGGDRFAAAVGYAIPTANAKVLVADFNRDGALDVALSGALLEDYSEVADTVLLLGKGNGTLNSHYQTYSTPLYSALVMDVNGDGVPDIVGTNGLTVGRLENTGSRQSNSSK